MVTQSPLSSSSSIEPSLEHSGQSLTLAGDQCSCGGGNKFVDFLKQEERLAPLGLTAQFSALLNEIDTLIETQHYDRPPGVNTPSLLGAVESESYALVAESPTEARFPPFVLPSSYNGDDVPTTSDPTRYIYVERDFSLTHPHFEGAPIYVIINDSGDGYFFLFEVNGGDLLSSRLVRAEKLTFDDLGQPTWPEPEQKLTEQETIVALSRARNLLQELGEVYISH